MLTFASDLPELKVSIDGGTYQSVSDAGLTVAFNERMQLVVSGLAGTETTVDVLWCGDQTIEPYFDETTIGDPFVGPQNNLISHLYVAGLVDLTDTAASPGFAVIPGFTATRVGS